MRGDVFTPPGTRCAKCGLALGFKRLPSGKYRPCNPDGSDHWDRCRDVRYAKAKTGECRERTWEQDGATFREVWWDGGAAPFFVLMSVKRSGQRRPSPDGGLIPIERHRAMAARDGYVVREVAT